MIPSFTRRRTRKSKSRFFHIAKGMLPWIAVSALGGFGVYALFFSTFFVIDRIDVSATGSLDSTDVRTALFEVMDTPVFGILSQKNFFLFREASARRHLEDQFAVQSLTIRKSLPNRLNVTLEGSPFRAVWVSGTTAWDLTARGRIKSVIDPYVIRGFPPSLLTSTSTLARPLVTSTSAIPDLPIIVDETAHQPTPETEVLDGPSLSFILSLSRLLAENRIRVLYFKTHSGSYDVRAVTKQGWEVVTTNREPADVQVAHLMTVLNEQIKKNRKKLNMVDVRFEQRIYYRLK